MRRLLVVVVIAGLLIAGLFVYEYTLTDKSTASLTVGANTRLDSNFQTNHTLQGTQTIQGDIQGDEPSVAVGGNGAIYVAWIGLSYFHNTTGDFETQIFFSESINNGASFSNPVPVSNISNPMSYYAFDPSVALSPNGTVFVSYLGEPLSGPSADSVMLAEERMPSSSYGIATFSSTIVSSGSYYDRPWITISPQGIIYAVWDSDGQIFQASSSVSDLNFSTPRYLSIYVKGFGFATTAEATGIETDASGTVYIPILAQNQSEYSALGVGGDQLYNVLLARIPNGSSGPENYNLATISTPPANNHFLTKEFHASPSIAVSPDGSVYVVYQSNNGTSLSLVESQAGSENFAAPVVLLHAKSSLVQMPSIALNRGANELSLVWMANSTGYWNAFTAVFPAGKPSILSPVELSSANGYPSETMNWHGDFLGVAYVSGDKYVAVWSDGRGLSGTYGYGHIYASIVS